jgi:hypothetical protein
MSQAYLHLLLNHFPIIATVIGLLVLIAGCFCSADGYTCIFNR